MTRDATDRAPLIRALLDGYGRTYAEDVGIDTAKDTPAPLFQLLCMSLLLSARIRSDNAVQAARALLRAGLSTPRKMADATWQDRVDVLTANGYKRYDESTASMLGETAEYVLNTYGGDLRRLRAAAGRDVGRERKLLQEHKGIGPVGADIFLREVQCVWDEAYPHADSRVLGAARRLGLPADARALAALVSRQEFPHLVSALIRVDLAGAYDDLRAAARRFRKPTVP